MTMSDRMRRALAFVRVPVLLFAVLALPARIFAGGMAFPEALTAGGPVEGRVLARTVMKKVRHSRVLESLELTAAPVEKGPDGAGRFALSGSGDDRRGAPFSISRYNRVMADYLDLDPDNPALAGLAFFLKKPDGGTAIFVSDPLACVERPTLAQVMGEKDAVNVARANWREKDYLYLIRRLFDRPFDEDWRYSMDGPSTFVQRRFDKELLDVGAVDVVLRRNQKVQVNLVVGFDPDRPRSRTALDWYKLPKRVFPLENGRTLLRIYIGRYLREQYPGAKSVILRELVLMFFKENQAEVLESRNVERIAFPASGLAPETMADGLPHGLPADADLVFTGRKQLSVNVSVLGKPEFAGLALTRAILSTPPLRADEPFGARLESVRLALVSPRDEIPAYLAATDELCSTFIGPRDLFAAPGPDGTGGPWLAGQRPLWSASFPFVGGRSRTAPKDAAERVTVLGADELFSAEAPIHFAEEGDGLGLSGRANALVMRIPGTFETDPGEAYSFWLELGRPGKDLTGAAFLADGYEAALKPNAAVRLENLPGRLTNVRLRFTFAGPEFSLNLRRAVFSAARAQGGGEGVFAAPLLMPWSASPEIPPRDLAALDADWLSFPPGKKNQGAAAVYLPGLRQAGESLESAYARLSLDPADEGAAAGATLTGSRLLNWAQVFGESPAAAIGGRSLTPADVTPREAAVMARENAWISLGETRIAPGADLDFADNPWFEARALLVETGNSLSPLSLSEPPKAPGKSGGRSLGLALGLGLLVAAAAYLAGRRLPWRRLGAPVAAYFSGQALDERQARRQAGIWFAASLALAAAGLVLGFGLGRASFVLAGLALVPVWRGVQAAPPGVARKLPEGLRDWFGATPGRRYFAGFVLAAVLAALLRSVKLTPVSEGVFTSGIYLLFIGLFLDAERRGPDGGDTKDI